MQKLSNSQVGIWDRRKLLSNIGDIFNARTGFKAYIPFMIVASLIFVTAFLEFTIWNVDDVLRYQCYAMAFWFGQNALHLQPQLQSQCDFLTQFSQYHTLPLEYPPFSLLFFSIPLLAPIQSYPIGFALCIALFAFGIYWLLLRYGPRSSASVFVIFLLVGATATAFARFDLIPAAFTLLCLILAERKRWVLAYIALALGALTKLYPVLFFPILFLTEQRENKEFYFPEQPITIKAAPQEVWKILRRYKQWQWKNSLIFIGICLGVTGIFGLFNIQEVVAGSFAYLSVRPIQVETISSVLLWLASLVGIPIKWEISFGSLNAVSPISGAVSLMMIILLGVGYVYIILQQCQRKMDLVQATIAVLFIVVVAGKVFSPQYLIWFIPLLAYSGASNRPWLSIWIAMSILTTLIYPVFYGLINWYFENLARLPVFYFLIVIRNVYFVLLTLAYLTNYKNLRQREPLPDIYELTPA